MIMLTLCHKNHGQRHESAGRVRVCFPGRGVESLAPGDSETMPGSNCQTCQDGTSSLDCICCYPDMAVH